MQISHDNTQIPEHAAYEIIDVKELARRWCVRPSWIYEHIRCRCPDPIPYVPLGKYPRFEWGSPKLESGGSELPEPGDARRIANPPRPSGAA